MNDGPPPYWLACAMLAATFCSWYAFTSIRAWIGVSHSAISTKLMSLLRPNEVGSWPKSGIRRTITLIMLLSNAA